METKTELVKLTGVKKVNALLQKEILVPDDVAGLNRYERERLEAVIVERLGDLKSTERDMFMNKIERLLTESSKNQLWEQNHILITEAIAKLMQKYGCMPSKSSLAAETGLSRPTIAKHIKEYEAHPEYLEQVERFKFMASKVLVNVFGLAVNGNMKAAKLYFEMTGALNKRKAGTIINEQNNYLQINNTILSQENLKQLSDDQLDQIEKIITSALPAEKTGMPG